MCRDFFLNMSLLPAVIIQECKKFKRSTNYKTVTGAKTTSTPRFFGHLTTPLYVATHAAGKFNNLFTQHHHQASSELNPVLSMFAL